MKNHLRALWNEGRPGVNAWLGIPSGITAEIVARQGFDAVTVDLQHGITDYSIAVSMLQAVTACRATPMARVPWLEPGIIMKMLDAGALGIVCPMVNTRSDAERFVRCCRYAPDGDRSFGPVRARLLHGPDYAKEANASVITLAMIETAQALEAVEEIARTPGLTGVYVGPSDLAVSLGREPQVDTEDPVVTDGVRRVLDVAKEVGLRAGMHCFSPPYARRMVELGFDLVTLGTDMQVFTAAYAGAIRAFRAP